jgi:hypothetical protein
LLPIWQMREKERERERERKSIVCAVLRACEVKSEDHKQGGRRERERERERGE